MQWLPECKCHQTDAVLELYLAVFLFLYIRLRNVEIISLFFLSKLIVYYLSYAIYLCTVQLIYYKC